MIYDILNMDFLCIFESYQLTKRIFSIMKNILRTLLLLVLPECIMGTIILS